MLRRLITFLSRGVWRIRISDLSRVRALWLRLLRVIVLSMKGFNEDKCYLRASALTFYALLSIVPVMAMAIAIAKGFGFETEIERLARENFQGQEEVITWVIDFAQKYLDKAKGGVVGGIGLLVLFYTVIKVLANIEFSFNEIWGIAKSRTISRKIGDYLSFMLVCPLLFILASSVEVFLHTEFLGFVESSKYLSWMSSMMLGVFRFFPFLIFWSLFSFMYIFMPNTKVRVIAAVAGGIIAGTLFQVLKLSFFSFIVGVTQYSAVYGSFAALPLFLIWLQFSWIIVLFGAELSFAWQNVDTYEFEQDCLRANNSIKRLFALRITQMVVRNFCKGGSPLNSDQIAKKLGLPIRLVRQLIFDLVNAGLFLEINGSESGSGGPYYIPGVDADEITISFVYEKLDHFGTADLPFENSEDVKSLEIAIADLKRIVAESRSNFKLKD